MDANKCFGCGRCNVEFGLKPIDPDNPPAPGEPRQRDTICVRCRFEQIDGFASSTRGIRDDMKDAGIPVRRGRNAKRLVFGDDGE